MDKKGVDISVNVIIVAAIALAVLVVLFAIFTGRMGGFSKGVSETASCENSCKALGMKLGNMVSGVTPEDSAKACRDAVGREYVPGTYTDVKQGVCCCQ